jgi:hypothetical protein
METYMVIVMTWNGVQEYSESDVRNTCPCDQPFWNSSCLDTNTH